MQYFLIFSTIFEKIVSQMSPNLANVWLNFGTIGQDFQIPSKGPESRINLLNKYIEPKNLKILAWDPPTPLSGSYAILSFSENSRKSNDLGQKWSQKPENGPSCIFLDCAGRVRPGFFIFCFFGKCLHNIAQYYTISGKNWQNCAILCNHLPKK